MEYKIIDLDTITETDLIEVLDENHKTAVLMQQEIKKLQKVATTIRKKAEIKEETTPVENKIQSVEETQEDSLEDEIDYYLTGLKNLSQETLTSDKMTTILPVKKNYNYKNILLRLKLETIKSINEIKELLTEDDISLTPEEMRYFRDEILLEQQKLALLDEKLLPQTASTVEEEVKNDLIFVPTSGGNIRVLEEIDKISSEYYEGFEGLFNSIKDRSFKNVKRFVASNNTTSGICEVKDYKIRVVFDRIGPNSYALITAFVKKSDNDKGYIETLKRKIAEYRHMQPLLKNNLSSNEFIKINQEYEDILFQKLQKDPNKVIRKGKK